MFFRCFPNETFLTNTFTPSKFSAKCRATVHLSHAAVLFIAVISIGSIVNINKLPFSEKLHNFVPGNSLNMIRNPIVFIIYARR